MTAGHMPDSRPALLSVRWPHAGSLPEYHLDGRLHESPHIVVHRGHRIADGQRVVLKAVRPESATPERLAVLTSEFHLLSRLSVPGVIRALSLERSGSSLALVMEDVGGSTVARHLERGSLAVEATLRLTIRVAEILGRLHRLGVTHMNVNPTNIVWNRHTDEVRLIDFGVAATAAAVDLDSRHWDAGECDLAYISPEQTGRMNRAADSRTDLYSLGVMLYRMLTGQPPFDSDDPMELVHAHLARRPVPPREIPGPAGVSDGDRPTPSAVGRLVSDITMRLLEKNAEDRYQTAWGLKADLEYCLAHLDDMPPRAVVKLGRHDVSDRLHIPQKLYGRERELAKLKSVADASIGHARLVLVCGGSGVGKSALVRELQKPITARRGYFIEGKFDQYKGNAPYSAWIQAFNELVSLYLLESEGELAAHKARILEYVGDAGRVLTDVIPNLELVIGPQPQVPEIGGREARNRFTHVFRGFVRAVARPGHPVVVFLDDLQWVDAASLGLLQVLLTESSGQDLILIGAYRDSEVERSHQLRGCIRSLRAASVKVDQILLANLSRRCVGELVSDALHCTAPVSRPLAELIHAKTAGNPLFIHHMLRSLYDEHLLLFDADRQEWTWEMPELRARDITDNVVELMIAKVRKYPKAEQDLLRLAACIGSRFHLTMLGAVAQLGEGTAQALLRRALDEGLLIPVKDDYKFAHDRIHQACYSLIPVAENRSVHLRIGRNLMAHTTLSDRDEHIFEIVDQLNPVSDLVTDRSERIELAELNLVAGRRAKSATAYESALRYLRLGLRLLPEDAWASHYLTCFELHVLAGECEYLTGGLESAGDHLDVALSNAASSVDRARVFALKIVISTTTGQYLAAKDWGLKALRDLGLNLPALGDVDALKAARDREFALYRRLRKTVDIASLARAPHVDDPTLQACITIYERIWIALYFIDQRLLALLEVQLLNLLMQRGNPPRASFVYVCVNPPLITQLRDYEGAHAFGRVGLELDRSDGNPGFTAMNMWGFAALLNHWHQHVRTNREVELEAIRRGEEVGDVICVENARWNLIRDMLFDGSQLAETIAVCAESIAYCRRMNDVGFALFLNALKHVALLLQGATVGPESLDSAGFSERDFWETMERIRFLPALAHLQIFKSAALFLLGRDAEAEKLLSTPEDRIAWASGQEHITLFTFYRSLMLCRQNSRSGNRKPRGKWLATIRQNQQQMKEWADNCPANFLNKYLLVEAELARLQAREAEAVRLYDRAISQAMDSGFLHEAALGHELAARFWTDSGNPLYARTHLLEALHSYALWGAQAKVRQLEEEYADMITPAPAEPRRQLPANDASRTPAGESTMASILDAAALAKTVRAISGEILLDRLLDKMMRIALESAGAQRGLLVLRRERRWVIETEADVDASGARGHPALLLAESRDLARGVVEQVIRERSAVALADAAVDGEHVQDRYIRERRPRSLLCMPLLNQAKLSGILYLENNRAAGVFTPERIDRLGLLSAHMAMALDNATLYQQAQNEISERRLAAEALAASQAQLRALAAKVDSLREQERLEISREIHDQLGQALTGLKLDLSWIEKQIGSSDVRATTAVQERVRAMRRLIDDSMPTVHHLVSSLRPPLLDDLGLEAALEWQGRDFEKRTGIRFAFSASSQPPGLDRRRSTIVFRVFQEVLTNVARHAEASAVECSLDTHSTQMTLAVADNGRGIGKAEIDSPRSLGLLGMRERLFEVGGTVAIHGVHNVGTKVTVQVPTQGVEGD
jgi:predicted ATPase/signal transduction histidine kinase